MERLSLTQEGHDEYQYVAHGAAGRAAFGNNDFRRGPVNVAVIAPCLAVNVSKCPLVDFVYE